MSYHRYISIGVYVNKFELSNMFGNFMCKCKIIYDQIFLKYQYRYQPQKSSTGQAILVCIYIHSSNTESLCYLFP